MSVCVCICRAFVHDCVCVMLYIPLTHAGSWLIAFLAQLNPLVAPQVDVGIAGHMRKVWANSIIPPELDNTTLYSRCEPILTVLSTCTYTSCSTFVYRLSFLVVNGQILVYT